MSRCGRALRALGLLLSCTAAATVAMAAAPAPIAFIDAHVHLNDVPMQLDLMAANGIPQAVVFWGRAGDNATVLAAARAHPQKFIPFASVSPERRDVPRAVDPRRSAPARGAGRTASRRRVPRHRRDLGRALPVARISRGRFRPCRAADDGHHGTRAPLPAPRARPLRDHAAPRVRGAAARASRRAGDLGPWRVHAVFPRPPSARAPSQPALRAVRAHVAPSSPLARLHDLQDRHRTLARVARVDRGDADAVRRGHRRDPSLAGGRPEEGRQRPPACCRS